jgi:DNA-binding MarR family transcriptional regulator
MTESGRPHDAIRPPPSITTGTAMTSPTAHTSDRTDAAPPAPVSAVLERSLTHVGRTILRLDVPQHVLPDGVSIGRTGYWLLVMVSEQAPLRLSDLAEQGELDLSTISRQIRDLVAAGLIARIPDPADGRAALLSLTDQGVAVLEAASESRRQMLATVIAEWTDEERDALADGLLRLGTGLQHLRDPQATDSRTDDRQRTDTDEGTR